MISYEQAFVKSVKEELLFKLMMCAVLRLRLGVLISCLIIKITDNLSLRCSVLSDWYMWSWRALLWQMDSRLDTVLGGVNYWLLAVGFMKGEDWITPGGTRSKTGEARLTLRHIMNTVEVSVSKDQGCRTGKERRGEGGNGKGKKQGGGWARVMERKSGSQHACMMAST